MNLSHTLNCRSNVNFYFRYQPFPPIVVQPLNHVWLFATPWTAAHQASLSSVISQRLLKLLSKDSVILSNHLILCRPLLLLPSIFPSIRVFSNESVLCIRWPKYWSLPMNIQGWFPLGSTGLSSLQCKRLWRVFSNTILKNQFFGAQPSFHLISLSIALNTVCLNVLNLPPGKLAHPFISWEIAFYFAFMYFHYITLCSCMWRKC